MKKTNKKIVVIAALVLVCLLAAFGLLYNKFSLKATAGAKNITIEVIDSKGESTSYELSTDAEYLKEAMDELAEEDKTFSYSGSNSDYGMMVEVINGEQAIYETDQAYWSLYVNGEYGLYGADSQPVTDSDHYTWQYESAAE